jgi:hypothetical protein
MGWTQRLRSPDPDDFHRRQPAGHAPGAAGRGRARTGRGQRVSAQTCAATAERCGRATDLPGCSGWCKRKHGSRKKFCRQADRQGVCTVEQNICVETKGSFPCGLDESGNECFCFETTADHSFCGLGGISADNCDCTSDKQCEKRIGTGAKCVQVNEACGCDDSTTACLGPCPKPNTI